MFQVKAENNMQRCDPFNTSVRRRALLVLTGLLWLPGLAGCDSFTGQVTPHVAAAPDTPNGRCPTEPWAGDALAYRVDSRSPAAVVEATRVGNLAAFELLDLRVEEPDLIDSSRLPDWIDVRSGTLRFGLHTSAEVQMRLGHWSVALVVGAPQRAGLLFSFNPFDSQNQALNLRYDGSRLCGEFLSSPSDGYEACTALETPPGQPVLVVMTVSGATGHLRMSMDGQLVPRSVIGSPEGPGIVDRTAFIAPDVPDQVALREFHLYRRALAGREESMLIEDLARRHGLPLEPSEALWEQGCTPVTVAGGEAFLAARTVIVSRCAGCHMSPNPHATWASWGEQRFIDEGYVSAEGLAGSPLYTRLQGAEVFGTGRQDMPLDANRLPVAERTLISNWIESLE